MSQAIGGKTFNLKVKKEGVFSKKWAIYNDKGFTGDEHLFNIPLEDADSKSQAKQAAIGRLEAKYE